MRRPWTRAGVVAMAAHVFYELGAGVAMPLAWRFGIAPVAGVYGVAAGIAVREAGRQSVSRDRAFAVLNGLVLSAVVTHFTSWPRTTRAGLPWLTECEGLTGRLMPAYNLILLASGTCAAGGLAESRGGRGLGLVTPLVVVPLMRRETPREYARLRAQAQRRPRWWNRRLR